MGFIDHRRSASDGRSVRISVTDKGANLRKLVEEIYQRHVRALDEVGGFTGDEISALTQVLRRLDRFWMDQILYRL